MNASPRLRLDASSHATPAERDQWLERFRRSNLSQAAFAQTHGLPLSTLRYWLYHRRRSPQRPTPAPRWQEIRLPGWSTAAGWGAEIGLPDGRTVRLTSDLARELVAPLLAKS
jgi:hypothetical protein